MVGWGYLHVKVTRLTKKMHKLAALLQALYKILNSEVILARGRSTFWQIRGDLSDCALVPPKRNAIEI